MKSGRGFVLFPVVPAGTVGVAAMCVVNDLSSQLNILRQCRSVELVCVPDENESHSISEMINKTKYSMECFLSILYHA